MFDLWLERAECAFLTAHFDEAERLIQELLQRAASKIDQAAIFCLKVQLHAAKGEYAQAVDDARMCLRLFDIDIPAHPTQEQAESEYATIWRVLKGRRIEDLTALPLMTDPDLQAATRPALGSFRPCLLYRRPFASLGRQPPGEYQHATRHERCVRASLWVARHDCGPGVSPLQRGLSLYQNRLRPCREAWLSPVSGKNLRIDGDWSASGRSRSQP